jgi:hypothetical protein
MPGNGLDYHPVYTIRGPKAGQPRPDEKQKDEHFDWGEKVTEIEMG